MEEREDLNHLSDKTWPSKKNHLMNHRDMYYSYKRGMWEKKKETGDIKWRNRLTEKEHREIITDLYLEIENEVVLKKRPVKIPFMGKLTIRKRKSSVGLNLIGDKLNKKARIKNLLNLAKKYFSYIHWDSSDAVSDNSKYYGFSLHPHTVKGHRGKARLKKL